MLVRSFSFFILICTLSACCNKPTDPNYPQKPDFDNLLSNSAREDIFGKIDYEPWWGKGNIKITNGWDKNNLISVYIPQLKGIKSFNNSAHKGYTRIHKDIQTQYKMLWHAWEKKGLLPLVHTWGGGYSARKVRGSYYFLSNHSFGSAFDINAAYNPFNGTPAKKGETGSVYDLVAIANEHGFYWGGHFCKTDGMHFEVAKILTQTEIADLSYKYGFKHK